MISYSLIKFIFIIVAIVIVASNNKYFTNLNRIYKTINKIPVVAMMIFALLTTIGIKIYNPFAQFQSSTNINDLLNNISNINSIPKIIKNMNKENINNQTIDTETISQDIENNDTNSQTPKYKRKVSESTKKIVAARQQWSCAICSRLLDETYEVDHIIPLYKGGSNDVTNLMALDPICHRKKTNADRLNIPIATYFKSEK